MEIFPGARALLQTLSPDQWAIVTSGTPQVARIRMRLCGISTPAVLVTANDVRQGKPAPEGYLNAARQLGMRPSACIVVEDTPPGVASGKAAGTAVIAVASTHAPDALRMADIIIPTLTDIGIAKGPSGGLTIRIGSAEH